MAPMAEQPSEEGPGSPRGGGCLRPLLGLPMVAAGFLLLVGRFGEKLGGGGHPLPAPSSDGEAMLLLVVRAPVFRGFTLMDG